MAAASTYVRLRGLPFVTTEQEVAQWFSQAPGGPLTVLRVLFTFNSYGRKSGEAFVELPEKAAEHAVQILNHRHLGSRYIEVFVSSEAEATQASVAPNPAGAAAQTSAGSWQAEGVAAPASNVLASRPQRSLAAVCPVIRPSAPGAGGGTAAQPHSRCSVQGLVRLRGLPFNVTVDTILQFFQGFHIPNGALGVHLALGSNGRPNGEAFVEFPSEEIADAALAKDRASIGQRYVEVFRTNPEQMHQALSRANKSNNLAPLSMQQQAGMQQAGMGAGMQHAGMGAGMAAGNGMPYGYGPYSGMPPHMFPGAMGGAGMGNPGMDSVIKMRGLPYKVTRNDILEFFGGLSVPLNGAHLMFNEREQPTGEAYIEFSSPDDRERAMTKDRAHMGGRYVELFRVGRGEMIQALEQFVGGYMNHNLQMQGGPMGAGHQPYGMYGAIQPGPYGQPPGYMGGPGCGAQGYGGMQQPMQGMPAGAMPGAPGGGPPGKEGTLRMRGIPFRVTVDEIFRFFAGFHIVPGGIVLGQRDGRPSGEAWVTFASPPEAQRALLGLNHKNLGSRYVELFAAT